VRFEAERVAFSIGVDDVSLTEWSNGKVAFSLELRLLGKVKLSHSRENAIGVMVDPLVDWVGEPDVVLSPMLLTKLD
jgi:hypothetical protein